MDDDLTFGTSVWATSEPITSGQDVMKSQVVSSFAQLDDTRLAFGDEFDDFETPAEVLQDGLNDNDDFGDFGEAQSNLPVTSAEPAVFDDFRIAGLSTQDWSPLILDPFPSRSSLERQINDILGPLWNYEDIADVTTDEPIREAEGVSQILITPSSREMYKNLLQTPPPTKPPNWTRSRIRQQHLIALGIPINLDEVLPRANVKPLPPLEIYTRPMSAPPGNRNQINGLTISRDGTPKPLEQGIFAQFGPKPELDMFRINKLLQLNAEQLAMQPLATVERYLADIKTQTANTSKLLTYLLQSRDALQQDSETYNGLIAEMVGQAQSLRSGKPRTASIRRGTSGMG